MKLIPPPLNQHQMCLSTRENDDNEQISTLQNYDLGIDIEGELLRILSSLQEESTDKEGEQNYHYQEPMHS